MNFGKLCNDSRNTNYKNIQKITLQSKSFESEKTGKNANNISECRIRFFSF